MGKKVLSALGLLLVFVASAALGVGSMFVWPYGPLYHHPLDVAWDESVGTIVRDIPYG